MKGNGGLFLFVMEDLVDGLAMGLTQNVSVLGLGVEFGRVLLEGDRFDRLAFLEGEGFALVVAFFVFCEGLSGSCGLVEADFFGVLVGLSAYSAGGLLLVISDFDFQVAEHPTITIIILNPSIYLIQYVDDHNPSPEDKLLEVF